MKNSFLKNEQSSSHGLEVAASKWNLNFRFVHLKSKISGAFWWGGKEKGQIAILLTILVLDAVLLISLGLALIFIDEIKTSSLVRQSAPAFYAADAGSEYALYQMVKKNVASGTNVSGNLEYVSSSFLVSWDRNTRSINSLGQYQNTLRRVTVSW